MNSAPSDNSTLIKRLRNPPFGTETSERNLMTEAADALEKQRDYWQERLRNIKRGVQATTTPRSGESQ